ncbi:MAG: glycoside hydrolase family 127 protein [Treponema sp.]|nr:glycoside hydrolase family 127 protein [Treponema sp.]
MNQTEFLDIKDISINDSFWSPIMERVRTKVIPYQWEALNDRVSGAEPSYCMRNFKIAAQMTHPELDYGVDNSLGHGGHVFQDSDLAKWIEAAAHSLVWHPDPELEKNLDSAIEIICGAQQKDGYLNTYYIISGLEKRFTNLKDNHELYCFGHFTEAAIAYYRAAGKRRLLDAMIFYADCIDSLIGPQDNKIRGYPGHEIAEMALLKLFGITKNKKHLDLALYFINQRGQKPLYFEDEIKKHGGSFHWNDSYFQFQYYQAGIPVRDQHIAEGHSVRAVYLYSGMADAARITNDAGLLKACGDLFNNISKKQMYITGSIGQSAYGESFSFDYDLPNDTVYAETCAAIGLAFFAQRMAALQPKGEYGDVLERALYNGIISGMSLDGQSFFYVNPLEVLPEACLKDRRLKHVKTERQKWFGCACCPPNLARIIASLGNYIHSYNENAIYTHLFAGSSSQFLLNGKNLTVKLETQYPRSGMVAVTFAMEGTARFDYGFRVPSWCQKFSVLLNNAPVNYKLRDGFAVIAGEWKNNDLLEINFEMPVTLVEANPNVRQDAGKLALTMGPVVYCLEEADNGNELQKIRLGSAQPAEAKTEFKKDFLGGINVITIQGKKIKNWDTQDLYRPAGLQEKTGQENSGYEDKSLKFIPYYAWANRGPGEMTVWVNK